MDKGFWARRLVLAFVIVGLVLFAVHAVRGYALQDSAAFGCLWGAIAATIFTGIGYIRYRRNPACMLPRRKPQ